MYESFNVSEKKLLGVLYENLFEDESFPEDLNKYFEEAWDVSKNRDFPEIKSDEFDRLGLGWMIPPKVWFPVHKSRALITSPYN